MLTLISIVLQLIVGFAAEYVVKLLTGALDKSNTFPPSLISSEGV